MIGRKRISQPRMIDSCKDRPSSAAWSMEETRTTPFRTLTPKTAMYPTAAEMLKLVPERYNANVPPMSANGRFNMISSASPKDWNVLKSRMKMIQTTSGTMMVRRANARCWSSNRPLQTMLYPGGNLTAESTFRMASATRLPMSRSRTLHLIAIRRRLPSRRIWAKPSVFLI